MDINRIKNLAYSWLADRSTKIAFKQLGSGCYGAAWLLPDGRVLKVGAEDGTSEYIEACAAWLVKHGEAPDCGPRVYHFEPVPYTPAYDSNLKRMGFFAIMERIETQESRLGYRPAYDSGLYSYSDVVPNALTMVKTVSPSTNLDDDHYQNFGYVKRNGRELCIIFDPSSTGRTTTARPVVGGTLRTAAVPKSGMKGAQWKRSPLQGLHHMQ